MSKKSKNFQLEDIINVNIAESFKAKKSDNDEKSRISNNTKCGRENDFAECVQASRNECDAPCMSALLTTVYTALPRFEFPEDGSPITITATGETGELEPTAGSLTLPDFNYFVRLNNKVCDEARMLWPLVPMIGPIINKLSNNVAISNASSITGPATANFIGKLFFTLNLHVLSKRMIKDPAQQIPLLNTGTPSDGMCICNSVSSAVWSYKFDLIFAATADIGTGVTLPSGALIPATLVGMVIFCNTPNVPSSFVVIVFPSGTENFTFIPPYTPLTSTNFNLFLSGQFLALDPDSPNQFIFKIFSPAHYVSFVPPRRECGNDNSWVATTLAITNI
jgi:hypothetical protein